MMLEVGKLYSCSGYFLLLYPDKEAAAAAAAAAATTAATTATTAASPAAYASAWSRKLGKPVIFCNPETPLLVLSVDKKYVEVLAGDRKGWIINEDWLNIGEIVNEAA
jgi:hypothetical protein